MDSTVQFEQAADTELAWLTEAEKKLSSLGDIKLEADQTTAQLQAQKVSLMPLGHYGCTHHKHKQQTCICVAHAINRSALCVQGLLHGHYAA